MRIESCRTATVLEENKMSKKLSQILKQQNFQNGFPVIGKDGYAGEQDGDMVLFAGFQISTRKAAEKIEIPEKAKIHWADYVPGRGWEGSVGIWASQTNPNEKTPLRFE